MLLLKNYILTPLIVSEITLSRIELQQGIFRKDWIFFTSVEYCKFIFPKSRVFNCKKCNGRKFFEF